MPKGKVKWFNNAKGYGFIIEEGCSDDLFAHFSSVQMEGYKTLKAGQPVSFDKKPGDKGTHAVNIVPDTEAVSSSRTDSLGDSAGNEQPSRTSNVVRMMNG